MTFTAASHPAKREGGVKYIHLMIHFLYEPGYIYHIPHNNGEQRLLNIVRKEEKVSFVITGFTTIGLILQQWGIVSYTWA